VDGNQKMKEHVAKTYQEKRLAFKKLFKAIPIAKSCISRRWAIKLDNVSPA